MSCVPTARYLMPYTHTKKTYTDTHRHTQTLTHRLREREKVTKLSKDCNKTPQKFQQARQRMYNKISQVKHRISSKILIEVKFAQFHFDKLPLNILWFNAN